MSVFSEAAKGELSRLLPDKECCRLAELSALMRAEGRVEIGRSGRTLSFHTEVATVARKIFHLLKINFEINPEITIIRKNRLKKNNVYIVRTNPKADIQPILELMWGKQRKLKSCCIKSYLRGMFLGCGSVTAPSKGYHLELVIEDEGQAEYLLSLASRVGVDFKIAIRKGRVVCYLKGIDGICGFFTTIGAHSAVLELESVRVVREMRNEVNRLVNCETANVDKVVSASLRQTRAIEFLIDRLGFDALPDSLRDIARLRLTEPDISLTELGEMLVPPIGKSGVNHRMRRLMDLAKANGYDG